MAKQGITKVVHFISSLKRGGRERQLLTIYKYNSPNNQAIKIVILNEAENSYLNEFNIRDSDLIRVNSKNFLLRLWQLFKILRKEKPDIVYTWGALEFFLALLVKPFFRFKLINGSIRHGITLKKFSHRWRTALLKISKYVVANSYAGLRANGLKKGFVLYNGVDEKFFLKQIPSGAVKDLLPKMEGLIIVSVANLVPYKDYLTVLNALARLKEKGLVFSYIIIGTGPMREQIEARVVQLNLDEVVKFISSTPRVEEFLGSSHIFVHSSLGEGCSNAIIEAMAAGLPVVATDVGGNPEIVTPDVGFLFPYGGEEELAAMLEDLIRNQELRTKLGHNARVKAQQHFSPPKMIANYFGIVNTIMVNN